ncbi:SgcJ/EcaC family oxidoreductase [Actinoalloteichus caeruleus]|uniref:SgcJ/EcaC family oxidoreductase n=1 Tax=Actinoalloteichus cyanogriseus TaxID=2893586 RepID=UPI0004AB9FA5|nr:SgcJ/EcaC family oxidoreductase [Actinoalloteichus caeruleus]
MATGSDRILTALVRDYEHAFNTNDARFMNDLFADDPVFVTFGGNLVDGKEELYRAQAAVLAPGGVLEHTSVSYTVERITRLDTGVAVIHARQRTRHSGTTDERAGKDPMESVLMLVAQLDDRGWRIRIGQNTPVT